MEVGIEESTHSHGDARTNFAFIEQAHDEFDEIDDE